MRKMGPAFAGNLRPRGRRAGGDCDGRSGPRSGSSRPSKARRRSRKVSSWATLMQPIRVALTGSTVSEPVNELLAVVGRERQPRGKDPRGRRCGAA